MDYHISLFAPVVSQDQSFLPGSGVFGEWFFNFCGHSVYQIRTDELRSQEGTEVALYGNEESAAETLLRVVLTILVLPVLYALLDKALFRSNNPDLHTNPLPDNWREKKPGVLFGQYQNSSGLATHKPFIVDVSHLTPNSFCLYISQEHPWKEPYFQIFQISKERKIFSDNNNGRLTEGQNVKFEGFTADSPESALRSFHEQKQQHWRFEQNPQVCDLVFTKPVSEVAPKTVPQAIQDTGHYFGVFPSIADFHKACPNNDPALFYSALDESYTLNIKNQIFSISYKENQFYIKLGGKFHSFPSYGALLQKIMPRVSGWEDKKD